MLYMLPSFRLRAGLDIMASGPTFTAPGAISASRSRFGISNTLATSILVFVALLNPCFSWSVSVADSDAHFAKVAEAKAGGDKAIVIIVLITMIIVILKNLHCQPDTSKAMARLETVAQHPARELMGHMQRLH